MVSAMEAKKGPDGVLEEFNRLTLATGDFMRPVALMSNCRPTRPRAMPRRPACRR